MEAMVPTIGRIVHYHDTDGATYPAVVTSVNAEGAVNLFVMKPNIVIVNQGEDGGKWDWMPFQKDQQARLGYKEAEEAQKPVEVAEEITPEEAVEDTLEPTDPTQPVEEVVGDDGADEAKAEAEDMTIEEAEMKAAEEAGGAAEAEAEQQNA